MPTLSSAQLINQTSGDVEYYSPPEIIEAARECMGGIDLDPFSSAKANERVRATHYFDGVNKDGFTAPWFGNVWTNHPFGRAYNKRAVEKMEQEFAVRSCYGEAQVHAICAITYACTSELWLQPLLTHPQCYLSPRTNYYLPDGSLKRGVTKGSVVTYFGQDIEAFANAFEKLGTVMVPYGKSPVDLNW